MRGRPQHDFWEKGHFELIKTENSRILARCLICSRVLKNTARSRLIIHRKACPGADIKIDESNLEISKDESHIEPEGDVEMESISNIVNGENEVIRTADQSDEGEEYESIQVFLDNNSDEICISPEFQAEKPGSSTPSNSQSPAHETKKIKLVRVSSAASASTCNLEDIHLAFTELFISSNIPFKTLNSVYLKRFLAKLNRNYKPPTLKELTTTYLDKIHEKFNARVPCEEQDAVLLLSGWKDFSDTSKCLVACLYLKAQNESQDTRVFLNTWDLDVDFIGDDSDIQTKVIQESYKLAKEFYNANIFAVISDNLQLEIGSVEIPLWHSVCHSYLAGCLAEDIIDQDDVKFVKQILQEVKNKDIELKILEAGGSRILLPSEKRYCTYRDSFRCFITNNPIVQDFLERENIDIHYTIRSAICNESFLKKIETYLNVIEPLCELIYLSQKRNTTLAEIAEKWMELSFPSEFQEHLEKRRAQALTPVAMSANFMHPSYRGRKFNSEQMKMVEYFLLEALDSPGLDQLLLFKRNEDVFKILAVKKVISYDTFWSMAERMCPELATFAKRLLCIPASVSYVDKIFSNWSGAHSSARNLLGMDLYRKLTKAHFELNLADNSSS
ncbi:unnamed protein product [Hermetia illucens]|uniref:HAT C-terminal dimerisation domain-containing protein n=2 Tax=Hermetia illucens TaxID=343691 RepID=A0A7R8Z1W3_HERIL|nr:unnamed protein product [Hermetia illucens]